jgi:hypothetical protein
MIPVDDYLIAVDERVITLLPDDCITLPYTLMMMQLLLRLRIDALAAFC